jgi:hypothetical protein
MKKVHKLTLSALTAAIAMATGAAQAAVILPNTDVNNTGGSELLLSIYNPTTGNTYSLDTGITFNGFNGAGAYSFNFASDPNLASAFSGGLNSGLLWGINAGDAVVAGSTVPQAGARLWSTINTNTAPSGVTGSIIQGSVSQLSNYLATVNTIGTHPTQTNGSDAWLGTGPGSYYSLMGTNWGSQAPMIPDVGAVGSSLYFMEAAQGSCASGFGGISCPVSAAANLTFAPGQWNLSTGGVLSYNVVSAVPVPAAMWLFGSGLLGLVGVARRRV